MITLMTTSGRSRNTPCFCGSGRKLKHCCGPHLRPVRTAELNDGCRWRFWAPHDNNDRYASEVAEHVCTAERVWIARGTDHGTTWLIDDEPATLLEVFDRLPGALYHWVAEQTMTTLNAAAPPVDCSSPETTHDADSEYPPHFAEIRELISEVIRLAHAGDAMQAHLPTNFTPNQPHHTQQPLAS
jgi:hypothetical protein